MATAYLIAFLKDIGTPYPAVVKVGVYSDSAQSLTHDWKTWPVDVLTVEGKDFQEAHTRLVNQITCQTPELAFAPLDWAIPWTKGDFSYDRPREKRQRELRQQNETSAMANLNGLLDALGASSIEDGLKLAEEAAQFKRVGGHPHPHGTLPALGPDADLGNWAATADFPPLRSK